MATSLYELNDWLLKLEYQIEEAELLEEEQEKIDGLIAAFDAVGDLTKEQIVECAYAIENYRAYGEMIKAKEKVLKKKRDAYTFREEKLKELMFSSLKRIGEKKVTDGLYTVSIRKKPDMLVVDVPEESIPDEYFKVERSLKRSELKKAVKNGDTTYGHMEDAGESLCIA